MSTMVTVLTPPETRRLTTTARAAAALGLGVVAAGALDGAIDQASDAIVAYCNREFAIATVQEVFPDKRRVLWLSWSPVVSVASVTGAGAYTRIGNAIYPGSPPSLGSEIGPAMVEYTGGYSLPFDGVDDTWTLPADIERAAILLVGSYSSISATGRDPSVKREDVDGISEVEYWVPGSSDGFPVMGVEALLARHRRLVIA